MKRIIMGCIGVVLVVAVLTAVAVAVPIAMSSCALNAKGYEKDTYTVTMYSGGKAVREWRGVSDYVRFSEVGFTLMVDGTYVNIVGDVVIEPE